MNGNGTGRLDGRFLPSDKNQASLRRTTDNDRPSHQDQRPALITGGAGFIGTNLADRLLSDGRRVVILDNLSRAGVQHNIRWLRDRHGSRLEMAPGDVRDPRAVASVVERTGTVFHFAAQVAVTTSIDAPALDFDVNARGTLNVLEALRACGRSGPLVFTSTNKVYGNLEDLGLRPDGTRYIPEDSLVAAFGVNERRGLDFHSPYGCSKGTADQYVLDYARVYGIDSVVFRMSCIYGPHQFGNEDQGWIAHFLIQALEEKPLTIYGDGMQVRDALYVEDLVEAFLRAEKNAARLAGKAFNIGGGQANTISLVELLDLIGALDGRRPKARFEAWRTADQRYYVSDTRRFQAATGWRPEVGVREGVERLYRWLAEARHGARPRLIREVAR